MTFVHLLLIQHMYVVELRIAIKASKHEDFSAYNRGRMSIAPARRRPTHVHRFPAHLSYIRADCATNPILRSSSTTDLETFEVRENQPRSRPSRPHFAFSEQGTSLSRAILGFGAPNVKGDYNSGRHLLFGGKRRKRERQHSSVREEEASI